MKKTGGVLAAAAVLCLAFLTPAAAGETKTITVSAAISLKDAFAEIGRIYETASGTRCIFNYGPSGDLVKQITGGAPVDVFASAAQKDMDEAARQGRIIASTRADFAANSVVLIAPAGSDGALTSFECLVAAKIIKIAVGNPVTVPAGRYAEEVLQFYKLLPGIKEKLIYTENVRQVLDYVVRGEVDAGIVYATDAAMRSTEIKLIATAPEASHKPVVYPLALVKGTKRASDADAFTAFVLSKEGRQILKKYGFKTGN
ncbi:MAG: molybdate ABC transporter substrate-binding protein [Thermodesulfobacteriota bacterium]